MAARVVAKSFSAAAPTNFSSAATGRSSSNTKASMTSARRTLPVIVLAIAGLAAFAQSPSPAAKEEISITWLGHAAFEIVSPGGTDLLVDPFLTKNPATPAEFKDLTRYHPSYILVTHSHGDHLGDAVELAKMSKAKIVSVYMPEPLKKGDLGRELIEPVNVGDHLTLGDVKVHVVP